jgi:hypothetical protein
VLASLRVWCGAASLQLNLPTAIRRLLWLKLETMSLAAALCVQVWRNWQL